MQHPFMIKERLETEGECLNIRKALYDKPMASITRPVCLSTLFTSTQALPRAMKQEKQLEGIQISGEVKIFLLVDCIIDLKDSQETLTADNHFQQNGRIQS